MSGYKQQRGIALVASLMILIIVTIVAVATMETTGMQLRMTNSTKDRQQAFQAAEAGLKFAELQIQENIGDRYNTANFYNECSGADCFTATCQGGLCFSGVWSTGDPDPSRCKTIDTSSPFTDFPWNDATLDVWNNTARHNTANLGTVSSEPIKYIVEFRCHKKDSAGDLLELFRVTVRAKSNNSNAEVMLQSNYMKI